MRESHPTVVVQGDTGRISPLMLAKPKAWSPTVKSSLVPMSYLRRLMRDSAPNVFGCPPALGWLRNSTH